MTMLPESVDAFQKKFEEIVSSTIAEHMLTPEIVIDAEVNFAELTFSFYNILQQMEPFGPQNMRPVFIARNVYESGYSKIVKEQHLRFVVKQGNVMLTGIGFSMAEKFYLLQNNVPLDVVFTLDLNEWNGTRSIQMKVIDVMPSVNKN